MKGDFIIKMEQKEIGRILRKYRDIFKALEDYDKKPLEKQSEKDVRIRLIPKRGDINA